MDPMTPGAALPAGAAPSTDSAVSSPTGVSEAAPEPGATATIAHLTPAHWERATRHLLCKALAEFAHERLLRPEPESASDPAAGGPASAPAPYARTPCARYTVHSDDRATAYRFTATLLALDHWHIDPDSLARTVEGRPEPLDALAFLTELRDTLGLSDHVLPLYLEEVTATLSSLAFKFAKPQMSVAGLADAGFQAIEAAMTEGHPCFVANSGRIGFGAGDFARYAPEAGLPVRLTWLAARRDLATFTAGEGLDYFTLLADELAPRTRVRFDQQLIERQLDPADYYLLPVHPWQWEHRIAVTFAGEVARHHLVHLGPGDDEHSAQQSIRTFYNLSRPTRHYVKTALSVLNMGFLRGLSAAYMEATPAINDWLAGLIAADPTFAAVRFSIIRERAAIGYHHRGYEAATVKGSPYRKMLAALWRESPVAGLEAGRSLATMASLLHVDGAGGSFAAELISRSGLAPERWLRDYLDAYLVPVLHSLFAYDLAYMPHGENVILVLGEDGGTVERVIFKDIAEEIVVMDPAAQLPPEVERVRADVPEDQRALAVLTDVVDCFLRFLSAILHTRGVLAEDVFWRTAAECVAGYQEGHPELAEQFARYDLFAGRFALSCLNRLQLRDNRQMVDLADPAAALQFAGTLANPLAAAHIAAAGTAGAAGGQDAGQSTCGER
jgi:siderophore synthetase component